MAEQETEQEVNSWTWKQVLFLNAPPRTTGRLLGALLIVIYSVILMAIPTVFFLYLKEKSPFWYAVAVAALALFVKFAPKKARNAS